MNLREIGCKDVTGYGPGPVAGLDISVVESSAGEIVSHFTVVIYIFLMLGKKELSQYK
jgi:hypothetical protein